MVSYVGFWFLVGSASGFLVGFAVGVGFLFLFGLLVGGVEYILWGGGVHTHTFLLFLDSFLTFGGFCLVCLVCWLGGGVLVVHTHIFVSDFSVFSCCFSVFFCFFYVFMCCFVHC